MTTTTTPDIALPAGADPDVEDWQHHEGLTYRLVWSQPMPLPDGLVDDVRTVVCQRSDGSIATEGDDAPLVYVNDTDHTPAEARALGLALLAAADLADAWAATCTSCRDWDSCPAHPKAGR